MMSVENNSARILIVDDHPNTATMLARVLRKLGPDVDVLTASSGEDALQQLGDGIADVLITDFMMPGMSGLELIERLNDGRKPGHTILITAYHTPGLETTTRRLDIQNYLVKPVDPEKVRDIVAGALENIIPYRAARKADDFQRPFKILIADDFHDNIRLLSVRLRNEGYEYVIARDGQEAIDKLRSEKPDLALLDVNMPKMDGFQVLRELRADTTIAHIPAIMITAARMGVRDVQEGLALGADDYVTKPVDWRELSARIRAKLRVKRAEDILRARNQELSILPKISQDLGERLDVEDLTKSLLTRTVGALGAANGNLVIFHPDGNLTFQMHRIFDFSPWTWGDLQERFVKEGIVTQVSISAKDLIIQNTRSDSTWLDIPNDPTRSAIAVPLKGRHDVIGVLTLTHNQVGYFNSDHLNILRTIASQAAVAVENAHLFARERKRVGELVGLNQVTHQIGLFTSLAEIKASLPQLLKAAFEYPVVAYWHVDGSHIELENLAGADHVPDSTQLESAPRQAVENRQTYPLLSKPITRSGPGSADGTAAPQSVIAVPLFQGEKVSGVVSIHSNRNGDFQESDRVLLETLCVQVGIVQDRIRAFETSEQEKRRLEAVLNGAADAILVFDRFSNLQMVNPVGQQLFTDVEAHIGRPLPLHQGYDDFIYLIEHSCNSCDEIVAELDWPDGRTFSIVLTPMEDDGHVAVLHDVSHFKKLERIKNEFIATASHDLKNPIHAVLGYSDLLKKAGPLNDTQTGFVDRISRATTQMHELVLNMLELVRVDLGMMLKPEAVDIKTLLDGVVEDLAAQADLTGLKILMHQTDQRPQIIGDAAQLRQVVRNLVGNAIKYSPGTEHVDIYFEVLENRAVIRIQDYGLGIPNEDLPFIFEKFYRVKTDDRRDIQGNGLGLAIVKSIVEQHGGQVTVESVLGEGSCFSIHLPVTQTEPTQYRVRSTS